LSRGIFQFADDDPVDRSIATGDEVVGTVANPTELSRYQRTKLVTFLNSELPLFDRVSGRTSVIQHIIETGDGERVKQR
jgi:hypothetical protein